MVIITWIVKRSINKGKRTRVTIWYIQNKDDESVKQNITGWKQEVANELYIVTVTQRRELKGHVERDVVEEEPISPSGKCLKVPPNIY